MSRIDARIRQLTRRAKKGFRYIAAPMMTWTYKSVGLGGPTGALRHDAARLKRYLTHTDPDQRLLLRAQSMNFDHVKLAAGTEEVRSRVISAAKEIYGNRYARMSVATRREITKTFEDVVHDLRSLTPRLDYLEVGSAQGLSMSLISSVAESVGCSGARVSVDPYFECGYLEGQHGPWSRGGISPSTKTTRGQALELYQSLGIGVELLEMTSGEALPMLLSNGRRFNLIYIDGFHEGLMPVHDLGLALALLKPGGIIMLDDHHWPDVKPLRLLAERHADCISKCWKVAAYRPSLVQAAVSD